MKSSELMDKQIMQLPGSQNNVHFSLLDPLEESEDECDDDRGFAFRQIRTPRAFQTHTSTLPHVQESGIMGHNGSAEVTEEKFEMAFISEINQILKEHFDDLIYLVNGLSARLSQVESKTRQLENSVDDLKFCSEYNNGKIDGKLRQIESILGEVQDSIHFLKDRHEISEAQLHLATLQVTGSVKESAYQKTMVQADSSVVVSSSASDQLTQPLPISGAFFPVLPLPYSDVFPTLRQNATPPAVPIRLHTQIIQNPSLDTKQHQSYYLPVEKTSKTTYEQYSVLPNQQQMQPAPSFYTQLHQVGSGRPFSKLPQLHKLHQGPGPVSPQAQHPWTNHPVETLVTPSNKSDLSILPSSSLPNGQHSRQLFCLNLPQEMQGQPLRRTNSGLPSAYPHASGHSSFGDKPFQDYSSSLGIGSGGTYNQVPNAHILPGGLPTASSVDIGSSSGSNINKVPINDIVDQVTAMGFRRDLVRATVRKLMENGQLVDLTAVLDKLMTGDGATAHQVGHFGR